MKAIFTILISLGSFLGLSAEVALLSILCQDMRWQQESEVCLWGKALQHSPIDRRDGLYGVLSCLNNDCRALDYDKLLI